MESAKQLQPFADEAKRFARSDRRVIVNKGALETPRQ